MILRGNDSLTYTSKMRKFCDYFLILSYFIYSIPLFSRPLDGGNGVQGNYIASDLATIFAEKSYQHSPFTYPTSPIRSFNKLLRLHCSKYLVIFRFSIECYTFQYNLLSDYYTFQYNLQSKYYTFQYIFATKVLLFTHICKHYQDFLIFL